MAYQDKLYSILLLLSLVPPLSHPASSYSMSLQTSFNFGGKILPYSQMKKLDDLKALEKTNLPERLVFAYVLTFPYVFIAPQISFCIFQSDTSCESQIRELIWAKNSFSKSILYKLGVCYCFTGMHKSQYLKMVFLRYFKWEKNKIQNAW